MGSHGHAMRPRASKRIIRRMPAHELAPPPTTERDRAYEALARTDETLGRLVAEHGRPDPFSWTLLDELAGQDAFAELAWHISGQQISTVAALAIYRRLLAAAGDTIDPQAIVAMTPEELRAAGLSGAKIRSLRDLAERVLDGRLDFDAVARSDDDAAQAQLQAVRGVGPWTAQLFLLHHLHRADVFPAADIGLQRGAQAAYALPERPTTVELAHRAESWRPWRSYAAALLWTSARPTS
jgi:DNA-3-methyladenine glycosylase II